MAASLLSTTSTVGFAATLFSAFEPNDVARNLVDEFKYDTLQQMRTAGLEQAQVPAQPWSGWYWPLNEGGLAYRYADLAFPKGTNVNWATVSNYLLSTLGVGPVKDLSPMEKYDFLLGDGNFTLTRAMIKTADDHQSGGNVEAWMGYCTGWANASMMMPRPMHSVYVTAANGKTQIEFRPSDIKALGALLWANGSSPARVVGTVCQENPVRRDPTTGRALDPACRDTNPATFHLSMVNQIGVSRRSFLIDSDSGYQVWNQPVSSYSYTYFNPATGKLAPLEAASVRLSDLANDPFKGVRASGAKFVVGVETQLTFIYETRPNVQQTDSPETDEKRVPVYKYDLELDDAGQIIGGEWYSRLHPDVLWVALPGSHPATSGDALVHPGDQWRPRQPLPTSWRTAARASGQYLQPLGLIVDKLFEWASQQ
ncbi:hypothetical protein WDW37_04810 [Bdellovibrionota bacterium FG-1]